MTAFPTYASTEEGSEYTVHPDDLLVRVNKAGGGTVGNKYVGQWNVSVTRNDGLVLFEGGFSTGMPHTHAWVAKAVYDMVGDKNGQS